MKKWSCYIFLLMFTMQSIHCLLGKYWDLGSKNQSMDCSKFEWPTEHLRDCFTPDKWHLACSTIQSYLTGISFWCEQGAEAAINRCHTFRHGLDHSSHAIYKLWWFLDFMYVLCLCNEEKKSGCTNVWLQKNFEVIINMYIYKIKLNFRWHFSCSDRILLFIICGMLWVLVLYG